MKRLLETTLLIIFLTVNLDATAAIFQYEAKHQAPAQLVAAMKPHLSPNTQVSISQNTLLVSANETELEKIKQMLSVLDKALKNYLVELKILNRRLDDWELNNVSPPGSHSGKKVTRYQTGSSQNRDKSFRLQMQEGYEGFIETGETFQHNELVSHYGKFIPKTTNKKLTSGFYLAVRATNNDTVNVMLTARSQNRQRRYTQETRSSALNSQLTIKKNQWALMATINATPQSSNRKNYTTNNNRTNKRFYYLKISEQ
ncbi:hypothetical protein FLL45_04035 [Aliikangiella marina]|uniref:Uncharacterized protein n=1 Tax=Aliikangiella marina TaxID=1712262 RepID=A0A545TIT9_9GAMM|nr:hypothetical protein [Aliikangiella marina]TQV77128.1 hypothetical protein FLL45_04035 [Aliikangiella marina]